MIAIQHSGSKYLKLLELQVKLYEKLIQLDQLLFECRTENGRYLLGVESTDQIETDIMETRLDIGEAELDLEQASNLWISSKGISDNTAQFAFEYNEQHLAISLNSTVLYWERLVDKTKSEKAKVYEKYLNHHAKIIEDTNRELFERAVEEKSGDSFEK